MTRKAGGVWARQERAIVVALRRGVDDIRARGQTDVGVGPLHGANLRIHKAIKRSVRALDTSAPWSARALDRAAEDARVNASLWSRWCRGEATPAESLAAWEHALAREEAAKPTQGERLDWAEAEIARLEALVKKLQAKEP